MPLRKTDEAAAPCSLGLQQPALLELTHCSLDGLVVHAQFGSEQVFARQCATPAPAQDFTAQMAGDLIGDGDEWRGAHVALYWILSGQVANAKNVEQKFPTLIIRIQPSHETSILIHYSERRAASSLPSFGRSINDGSRPAGVEWRGDE